MNWKKSKLNGMTIYKAKNDYGHKYVVKCWPSGVQLCEDGCHQGNYKTASLAMRAAEGGL